MVANHKITGALASIAFCLGVVLGSGSMATATNDANSGGRGSNNPGNKVTLCHATGSSTNPYVRITVNANGAVNGHDKHSRDIIPPFTYKSKGQQKNYSGKNWSAEGQAIFNNGCKRPNQVNPQTHPPQNSNPQEGGRGGGQVSGATTTRENVGGRGGGTVAAATTQNQVEAPVGAVNAGYGAAPTLNPIALAGLLGSLGAAAIGLRRL